MFARFRVVEDRDEWFDIVGVSNYFVGEGDGFGELSVGGSGVGGSEGEGEEAAK